MNVNEEWISDKTRMVWRGKDAMNHDLDGRLKESTGALSFLPWAFFLLSRRALFAARFAFFCAASCWRFLSSRSCAAFSAACTRSWFWTTERINSPFRSVLWFLDWTGQEQEGGGPWRLDSKKCRWPTCNGEPWRELKVKNLGVAPGMQKNRGWLLLAAAH